MENLSEIQYEFVLEQSHVQNIILEKHENKC